jgi:hypothetical protein
MSEFNKRPLKELGSKAIQDAIQKAISELTGTEYEADVVKIDFESYPQAYAHDIVEIKLRLQKHYDYSDFFNRSNDDA